MRTSVGGLAGNRHRISDIDGGEKRPESGVFPDRESGNRRLNVAYCPTNLRMRGTAAIVDAWEGSNHRGFVGVLDVIRSPTPTA